MTEPLEVQSVASSNISENTREQILGKSYRRKDQKSAKLLYEKVPSNTKSIEKIRSGSGGDNKANTKVSDTTLVLVDADGRRVSATESKKNSLVIEEKRQSDTERKNSSFVIVLHPDETPSKSEHSMKPSNYTTIQTQTVGIQTIATGTDPDLECKCSWGDHECGCPECQPQNCRYGFSKPKSAVPETSSDPSISFEHTDTSSQTIDVEKRYRNRCTCNCKSWDYDSVATDQISDSDDSYTTDFFDLPYQNNDEYLQVLRELEKKLLQRNRERVRRTMMEFERKSRQNQNLEKPICEYNCDDTASMLRKLATKKVKNKVCCNCGKNKRVNSDILQNEKRWNEIDYVQSVIQGHENGVPPSKRIERSLHKSHWRLDPRSGEWVKVSCFQQTDFCKSANGDYLQEDPKKSSCGKRKKECHCRQKPRH